MRVVTRDDAKASTIKSQHRVSWATPWQTKILQQRAERKALERSAKRNQRIRHLEEESCLAVAHLQSLKEQLETKTYVRREPEPESEEEYRSALCAHLSLHKAFRA